MATVPTAAFRRVIRSAPAETCVRRTSSFSVFRPQHRAIGYWGDGINYWAEFDIREDAFRHLFRKFQFREIYEPLTMHPKIFGDREVFPPDVRTEPVTVSSGLSYSDRWSNGGGYDIVYDRSRSRAYYDFRKR